MPQMGSVQIDPSGDCIGNTSIEQLHSSDSSNIYNVFGEPELHPRVGEEYQVEIPSLFAKSQYHLYKKSPFELKSKPIIPSDFLIGLPIPIMHINKEPELEKCLVLCESKKEAYEKHINKGHCLLPSLVGGAWNKIEEGCFLLGLYIFGKDLDLMKKFVEGKTMGDIQSYYYGKFYKSNEYRRWSRFRKVRNKKRVYGHKLFTGMRQQKLLSRLSSNVSEEFQINLSGATKSYSDGKLSIIEYAFALKAIVGEKIFVEAVAIGKGKRDLTSTTMEPPKDTQIVLPRSELPSGKACSSLTPEEIAKFLTGGVRLSKARSNDLFWEAVWPRLLARGWRSEQPKDQTYTFGTKGTLVFLMPGVKKFSRRKLVKGNHYFDCVTDILNKIALDPSLIELDSEGGENNGNKVEDGWTKENSPENDDVSSKRRHRYLQPRTPNRIKGVMKFTIVDTSMTGGKVFKIRELRMVNDEVSNTSIVSETHSEGSDDTGSEDSSQDSYIKDSTTKSEDIKKSPPICSLFQDKVIETKSAIEESNDPAFEYKVPKRVREDDDLGEVRGPKKSPKCYRGLKKADHKYLSPITKRSRKLSSCTQSTKASDQILKPDVNPTFTQEKHASCSEATDSSENNQMASFSKESSFEGSQGFACDTNVFLEGLSNKPQTRRLIDLNFPEVSPDFENGEVLMTGSNDEKGDVTSKPEAFTANPQVSPEFENGEVLMTGLKDEKGDQMGKSDIFTVAEYTTDVISSDHQPNNNPRRHSTRNRPPTLKALEALANGFLTVNTRKKKKQAGPCKTSSSRQPNRVSGVTEDLGNNGSEDTQMTDVENVESNGDSGAFE